MTMELITVGRNVRHLQDLDGKATTDANETNLFTGGMVHANGYVDMGPLTGTTVNVIIAETGGLGGGTFRYYAAMKMDGTWNYTAATNTTASASTTYQFTIANCPRYLRFTIQRTAANITVKFKVSGAGVGGNM